MSTDFDFNSLSDQSNEQSDVALHEAHVQARADVAPLDEHGTGNDLTGTMVATEDSPVASTGASTGKGKHDKHGKKHHDEPAPAPVADVEEVDVLVPLAPTHDENKGFMRFMPPLVKEMNRRGVPFKLDGATGDITIAGFYRSSGVSLEIGDGDAITAVDRRNARTTVTSFDDLVRLNYDWWIRTNGKTGENHQNPDRPWLDEFLTRGMVKRQVIFVPRDDAPGSED